MTHNVAYLHLEVRSLDQLAKRRWCRDHAGALTKLDSALLNALLDQLTRRTSMVCSRDTQVILQEVDWRFDAQHFVSASAQGDP